MRVDVVDGADVRVAQRGRDARLALEALDRALVAGELRREKLQRDAAAEAMITGFVDLAHAARAEPRDDLVVGYLLANHGVPKIIPVRCADRCAARACGTARGAG